MRSILRRWQCQGAFSQGIAPPLLGMVRWCIMVQHDSPVQRGKHRISVTFSAEIYEELQRIADSKKVSLAWVVRDAVERYLHEDTPLLYPRA